MYSICFTPFLLPVPIPFASCPDSSISSHTPFSALITLAPQFIRAVCESGASHIMTSQISLFNSLTYFDANSPSPTAIMGDGSTQLLIVRYDFIAYILHKHLIRQILTGPRIFVRPVRHLVYVHCLCYHLSFGFCHST
jgi:hypothetical protein